VSVAQAARLLGVHPNTVRTWTDAGRLPAYRINARGDRRFRRSDVERLLLDDGAPRATDHVPEPSARRDAAMAALDRLARAGASASSPAAVSRLAVDTLRSQLELPKVAVYLARGEAFVLESHGGYPSAPPATLPMRSDEQVTATPAGGLRLPLVAGSLRVGLIVLDDLPPNRDDVFLVTVANAIAMTLGSAQLLSRLRRELRRARALRGVITELSGQLDLSELLHEVVQRTRGLFDADRGGLWLVGDGRHPFTLAAQHGLSDAFLARTSRLTIDSETLGVEAVRNQQPIARAHIVAGKGVGTMGEAYAEEGIRTACLIPLVADGRAVGLLGLYHDTDREWPDDEMALVRAFANQAAIAISNARLYRSVAEQAARMQSIQDLSARLNRLNEVRAIGQAIVDEASTLAEYHDIRVYSVDWTRRMCDPIAFTKEMLGEGGDYVERLRVEVGEGFTGWVAEHGEALLIDNALEDPRGMTIDDTDDIEESMVVVPMIFEKTVLGVIVLSQLGFGRFTPDDLQTMKIFAGYAAQAIANATAYERLAEQSEQLARQLESQRRLLEINERLLSALDPSEVFQTIADSLRAVVRYDNLSIYRTDREARVLRPVLTRERFAEEVQRYLIPFGRGLMGWVVEHGEPVLANDALNDPRVVQIPGTPAEPEALVVVPLIFDGEVIGAMNVSRIGEGEIGFSAADFELVKLFAGQASIALRNADEHHAVAQRADTDALTGMGNHGAFQRILASAIDAAQAADSTVGLLMMDLDRFKGYNDALGHPAGDRLLHAIATAIYGAARSEDRVFRYGGDEFALILAGIEPKDIGPVAERVRRAVARVSGESDPTVTITIGVAMYPRDAADKNDLIAAADTALYYGKQAGEDRVVHVDELPAEVRTLRGRLDELARVALRHPTEAGHVEELVEQAVRGGDAVEGGEDADASSPRGMLLALARMLESRDARTRGHGDRVGRLAHQVALELGCDEATASSIELGARLHDMGRGDPLHGMRLVEDVVGWGHAPGREELGSDTDTVGDHIVAAAHAYDVLMAEDGSAQAGRRDAVNAIRERPDLSSEVVDALERVVGGRSSPEARRRHVDEVSGAA
jgi:diguanylate cyclase (GGDEF)-like protein/excisionase family DNA binding protein